VKEDSMGDQAETLRKLAGAAPAPAGEPKKDTTERSAKVITVTSGKGGWARPT
jgi:Mrp family chromosome partitioning ATPase